MGIETAIAMSVLSAAGTIMSARQQAKTAVKEGEARAAELSKSTRLKAAAQQVSFTNSGLSLEGTPMGVIQSTYSTGLEDINATLRNANSSARSAMTSGVIKAGTGLASSFSGIDWSSQLSQSTMYSGSQMPVVGNSFGDMYVDSFRSQGLF